MAKKPKYKSKESNTGPFGRSRLRKLIKEAKNFDVKAFLHASVKQQDTTPDQRAALQRAGESLKTLLGSHKTRLQMALKEHNRNLNKAVNQTRTIENNRVAGLERTIGELQRTIKEQSKKLHKESKISDVPQTKIPAKDESKPPVKAIIDKQKKYLGRLAKYTASFVQNENEPTVKTILNKQKKYLGRLVKINASLASL